MLKEQVLQLLGQALDKNKSLFLIDFSITGSNQIRVVIDGDNGVTVNDCIAVSREIEHNIDRDEIDFSLDVASAGVSEPLSEIRQYSKNIGRNLKVITSEREVIEGKLEAADQEAITLKWKAREPKPIGKGKVTVNKEAVLPYSTIVEAKVMIKF
ncbi:MAG: ribosome assembly cofactor RimP [Flavobacteriaceae bacterium]|nr:ribosome assembly cofactor RimP [Flavobacteriaceae bacterium]